MTISYSSSFIKPEVWAASVMASVRGNLVFSQLATVFNELAGQPGDTINLTEFARLSDLTADNDETVELLPELLTSDATPLVIKEASKAAVISWRAGKTAFGDPVEVARQETARVIAKRIDQVLVDAAASAATFDAATDAAIDYASVIAALAPYGDTVAGAEGISLVIHSKQFRDLLADPAFARARRGETAGAGYVGSLDEIIPVYVSDLVPVMTDGGGVGIDHYRALLFQAKPLALAMKSDIETNQAEDILKRTTTVASTLYFAAGAMRPERIVELRTL